MIYNRKMLYLSIRRIGKKKERRKQRTNERRDVIIDRQANKVYRTQLLQLSSTKKNVVFLLSANIRRRRRRSVCDR